MVPTMLLTENGDQESSWVDWNVLVFRYGYQTSYGRNLVNE